MPRKIIPRDDAPAPTPVVEEISIPQCVDVNTMIPPIGKAPPKKRKSRGITDEVWGRSKTKVLDRLESGEWEYTSPKEFAALYAILHERVYGVSPSEMNIPTERLPAISMAKRMLEKEFDNNAPMMAEFFKWVWSRESWKFKKITSQGKVFEYRITWRQQFNGKLLTDWRSTVLQHVRPARQA